VTVSHWFKIVTALFLLSLIGQYITQVAIEGETFTHYLGAVLENWQSEAAQLLIQAIGVIGIFAWRDNRQGLDTDVELHRKVDELLRR